MENITNLWDKLMANIPNYIEALILLILAFICASIVKSLVRGTMKILKLDVVLDKAKLDDNKKTSLKDFIAKLFYLITFILFVPGVFEKLGLTGVSAPIVAMMDKLLTYLPNVIAATIILIIGLCISKGVKELIIPVFKKLNVDKYIEKAGVKSDSKVTVSEVLGNFVYVLILIPVIIASLDSLKIKAISKPATEMLNNILIFMPRVIVAIVIIYVGKFIADLACGLLENLLISIGTDKATENIMKASDTKISKDFSLSKIIAQILKIVIIIFFVVEGVNILQLEVLTSIGNSTIAYMPYAISSVIIMLLAILAGNFVESSINKKFNDSKTIAFISKVAIVVVGVFVTLYQLGIAKTMVNSAFIIILCAFAVAFAIAFGVGGRDFAKSMLSKLEKRVDSKSNK